MRRLNIAVVTCCVLIARPAPAQEPAALPLTLADALARAQEASHRVAETLARERGAQAAVRTREVADLPTVAVSGGYTRTNHVDAFGVPQPDGALRVIYPDIPDNVFSRATLQWPIYTGGRSDALVRAAEAEARAAGADVEAARADLRLEVARSYWALVTATESVRVVEEALARAEAHLRDMQSRFENGLVPPNEVSAAEAQRSRQQLQLIEVRNMRRSTLEDLRRLTGIEQDILPAEPLAEDGTEPPPPAQDTRAELRAVADRIAASEERVAAIEAGRRPTIALNVSGDYANPNPRIFPRADRWQTSWEIGVVANWTLWDGGRVAAERAEAEAATAALAARQAELTSVISTNVRQRQLDVESAHAALAAADAAVQSAAETRRVVGERFNVGVATSTDVLDAQLALLQAELDRTRTRANIRLSHARLERALGVR